MENLNKQIINNGIILGILSVAMQIIIYYAFPSIIGSFSFSIIFAIFSLLLYIFFTLDLKKKITVYFTKETSMMKHSGIIQQKQTIQCG